MATNTIKSSLVKKSATHKIKKSVSLKKIPKKTGTSFLSKNVATKIFRQDSKQTASLIKVGRISAANAIRESKALGLSMIFMEKGVLYKELPDGKKVIVEKGIKNQNVIGSVILKKGMIFHAKK